MIFESNTRARNMAEQVLQHLDEDFLQCAICMDRYKNPVMLPCLHSFCLPCLDRQGDGSQVESLQCPTCRRLVKLTSSGYRGLPNNFFLASLVDRLSLVEKLSTKSSSKCKFCPTEGSNLFCLDCQSHFCDSCKAVHSSLPGMDEHTIISANKLSDKKYMEEVTACQPPHCEKHNREKLRFYCKSCKKMLCRDCTVVDHQGHTCVEIDKEFSAAKARIQELIERGEKCSQITHELAIDLELSSKRIEDQAAAMCKLINEHAEKMIVKMKSDKESLEKNLEESKSQRIAPLEESRTNATDWIETMKNTDRIARRVLEGNNPWEILGMERKLHDTFDRLHSEYTSFKSPKEGDPFADDLDLKYRIQSTTAAHGDRALSGPLDLPNLLGRLTPDDTREKKSAGPLGISMACIYLSILVGVLLLVFTSCLPHPEPQWCPSNMIMMSCSCQASCAQPDVCERTCTKEDTCGCPEGFLMDEDDCISPEECGCFEPEIGVIPEGTSVAHSDCSKRCSCDASQLTCDVIYRCDENALCEERNNTRGCYCRSGYRGDGTTCTIATHTDCYDVYTSGSVNDGVYTIDPSGWPGEGFEVYCNMSDGGGWTVFQRRQDGSVNFRYQDWAGYKAGFGTPTTELWLGNEKLYHMTSRKTYEMQIDFVNSEGLNYNMNYDSFHVSSEADDYRLTLGTFTGNTGYDYMIKHRGVAFSTRDDDNDLNTGYNCAYYHRGGWWYNVDCYSANLNGDYSHTSYYGVALYDLDTFTYTHRLRYTEMKVRPV